VNYLRTAEQPAELIGRRRRAYSPPLPFQAPALRLIRGPKAIE